MPGTKGLWVGDIHTQKTYLANISDVGVVKDFYAGEGGRHKDDLDAAPDLRRFLAGHSDVSPNLTTFIAWLAARTLWLRRWVQEGFPAQRVTQDQHPDALWLQARLFETEHFPKMNWIRARAPIGHYFITSDRPVCWDILGVGAKNSPAALRHHWVELTLPLGVSCALVAGHGHESRSWNVDEINERTCAGAERFIYGHSKEDVTNLMQRRHGKGQRVH